MLHESVHDLLHTYGYAGIFVLLFVENFGIPVPGQAVFVVAILLAAKGELQLLPVAITAWTASVLGGFVGFTIGRFGGHRLLVQYGRYIWITPERLKKAEGFFSHYGGGVILLARFFEGLRQIYGILAGSLNISWRYFIVCNLAGATLWAAVWIGLLLWFGRHMHHIWVVFRDHELLILLGIGIASFAAAGILHMIQRRKAGSSIP
ncbi:MAG TPA: DedA family protein [Planctomycetaceae bacterium]|nr:DedA family protein [Planctomycetaceae bacterium]